MRKVENFLKEMNYLKEKYPDIEITLSKEDNIEEFFDKLIKEEYRQNTSIEKEKV